MAGRRHACYFDPRHTQNARNIYSQPIAAPYTSIGMGVQRSHVHTARIMIELIVCRSGTTGLCPSPQVWLLTGRHSGAPSGGKGVRPPGRLLHSLSPSRRSRAVQATGRNLTSKLLHTQNIGSPNDVPDIRRRQDVENLENSHEDGEVSNISPHLGDVDFVERIDEFAPIHLQCGGQNVFKKNIRSRRRSQSDSPGSCPARDRGTRCSGTQQLFLHRSKNAGV